MYLRQVVIVSKKTGEVHLCVDYRKLNSITIRDAFPLPCIDEALQAVHQIYWFTSFDLAQGYLQLAMPEEDLKKTTFKVGSSGLYEFTHMPFGLSNAGSSFSHVMEQCLGDQQFTTLLLYLDDICIFVPDVDVMSDEIEMVFNRLKNFHLKIKPKKRHFFKSSVACFQAMSFLLIAFQPIQKRMIRWRIGLCPRVPRSYTHFLALHLTTGISSQCLLIWHNVFTTWLVWSVPKGRIQRKPIVQVSQPILEQNLLSGWKNIRLFWCI